MTREDYKRFEPIRMARRPNGCHLGERCWVKAGLAALLAQNGIKERCGGCGESIPICKPPSGQEIAACGGPIGDLALIEYDQPPKA